MKHPRRILITRALFAHPLVGLLCLGFSPLLGAQAPTAVSVTLDDEKPHATLHPVDRPATMRPTPSGETRAAAAGWLDGRPWMDQHRDICRIGRDHPVDVVFLGDSITQSLGGPGRRVRAAADDLFRGELGHLHPASFGISGDRTQHLLWRIDHGAFDRIDPKAVVLMIGTNNLPHDPAEDIARGIEAVVLRLERAAPRARIVLMQVPPRGGTTDHPHRVKAARVNALIRHLEDRPRVFGASLWNILLHEDGRANPKTLRGDHVHITRAGYAAWIKTVRPLLEESMRGIDGGPGVETSGPDASDTERLESHGKATRDPSHAVATNPIAIIPAPAALVRREGYFHFGWDTALVTDGSPGAEAAAGYLADTIRRGTGAGLPRRIAREAGGISEAHPHRGTGDTNRIPGAVLLRTRKPPDDGRPGDHRLDVASDGIVIEAPSAEGLFHGVATLLQLLPPAVLKRTPRAGIFPAAIPSLHIADEPRFGWRGLMLDASRHFQRPEYVKRLLDIMALHKLNVFHWHLVDGHGWRIEIEKYPELTRVGAWRNQPGYDSGPYGGFYTRDEIREIVAYAKARHITIVPEIEMPGHSWAAIAAYPWLSCKDEPQEVAYFFDYPCRAQRFPSIPGSDVLCAGKEETFVFLEGVLDEVLKLFPGNFIHVGGDEVDKRHWRACPLCRKRMEEEGLADADALQSWFIRRMERYLSARGRRLIGWDEILEGGLAPGATVMSWRGTQGGIAAARQGHDVVMSPQQALYLDHFQSPGPDHPPAWPGLNTLATVYGYEPVPDALTPGQANHVLGAQGNLWTCFTHTEDLLDLMTWPRACALSEICWSPRARRDLDDFMERMKVHRDRLDALGVNHYAGRCARIGGWNPEGLFPGRTMLRLDVTDALDEAGRWYVTAKYRRGQHGLDLFGARLFEGGRLVAHDAHRGFTGWQSRDHHYVLDAPTPKPGARYRLELDVSGAGGEDSTGDVHFGKMP